MPEEVIPIEVSFGVNAGKVWQALNKLGAATVLMMRNETKLSTDEVHGGLGWLAREGKIAQVKEGKLTKFKLVE
ncbi:MAG: hypothetical protein FJ149_07025 [Euryarchaeota archaeon]|nr:hypothetical protein [Euryarchaeota archaeon]